MTARDRTIIVVVLLFAALAGGWFVGVAPKRKEAADLRTQIDAAKRDLTAAQQQAAQARQAKDRYDADYADVARLGKAVPKSDALPSLLYQLQASAHGAKIDFDSLKIAGTQTAASGSPASASTTTASGSSSSAAATQSATAGLPPGAAVGSAGFPTMPFTFVFHGSFGDMERLLHDVQRFVRVDGDRVDVRGRLLSIDGFSLSAGPNGFPSVTANIAATAYLMSPNDDAASTPKPTGSTAAAADVVPTEVSP